MTIRRSVPSLFLAAFIAFIALDALPTPACAASAKWMERIAFRDSMINLEVAREHLQSTPPPGLVLPTGANPIWFGRVVYRLPGNRIGDERHFRRFAVEYREGVAIRAWGVIPSSGSGLGEIPIYSYPPTPGSRSLVVSLGSKWPGAPTGGKDSPRDLLRIVLEPQADSATAPGYSVQEVYGKLGTMEVGSTRHLLLLFDGNRDGKFSKDLLDGLFVDLNNDRHFDIDLGSPEYAPLRVPFELGGFTYEAISVAPDGSEVLLRRGSPAEPFHPARIGDPAPEFSSHSADGREITLREFRGRPVIIFFWASWCPSCRTQATGLANLLAKYHSAGLEILGLNLESELDGARSFLAAYGRGWTNSFTEREVWENGTARRYGVSGPGILCLVDRTGILRARSPGIAEVEEALRDLLSAPAGKN